MTPVFRFKFIPVFLVIAMSGLYLCSHRSENKGDSFQKEIKKAWAQRVPDYKTRRLRLKKELNALEAAVLAAERRGEEVACASQISSEASWLLGYTAELDRAEQRLACLKAELAEPAGRRKPDEQAKTDGAWGRCFTEWFFKLSTSGDHILALSEKGQVAEYPPRFLDKINSPRQFFSYFDSILITDVLKTGRIQRKELNESISTLTRLIMRDQPANYHFHPGLKDALLECILRRWQDNESGYWGAWYRREDGTVTKTKDLSITFHLVSYLKGNVPHLNRLFKTTLAIRREQYPLGWLEQGGYENHHNYDVLRLLRYGWPEADPGDRAAARKEIRKMLDWCLSSSLQPDGSFILGGSDDSVEDSYYFGVSFLDEAGFFDPKKRFWSDDELPPSSVIRQKLIQRIHDAGAVGGKSGVYYRNALEKLGTGGGR